MTAYDMDNVLLNLSAVCGDSLTPQALYDASLMLSGELSKDNPEDADAMDAVLDKCSAKLLRFAGQWSVQQSTELRTRLLQDRLREISTRIIIKEKR